MLDSNFFFAYLLLAIVVTVLAVRMSKPKWAKWAFGVSLPLAFWAFGHIDDVLGASELRILCEKEAGIRVYKAATLPKSFYDQSGRPTFLRAGGPKDKALDGYIRFEFRTTGSYSNKSLRIDKYTYRIIDVRSGDVLAESVDFGAWPSPFIPSLLQENARGCFANDMEKATEQSREMYRNVFPPIG